MKKYLNCFMVLLLSFTIGFSFAASFDVEAQPAKETVAVISQGEIKQQREESVAVVSVEEEAPKLCKDEQGQAKVCSDEDFLKQLAASFGGMKGATALTIAGLLVNLIMYFLYSPMGVSILPKKFATDGYKLLLALFLYLVSGIIGLMLPPTSLPFLAALTHSTSLAAFGVLMNQAMKKYLKSKVAAAKAAL